MLFDTEERLKKWAAEDVKWVGVPGFVLALAISSYSYNSLMLSPAALPELSQE